MPIKVKVSRGPRTIQRLELKAIKVEKPRRGDSPGQYRRAEAEEAGRGGWRRRVTEEEQEEGGKEGEGAEG